MKQFECFRLDTSNQCLWKSGVQLTLPLKPFAVLRYLVENPGRLITHDELLDALWPETYVQPQVLRTYMLELRKVLGDDIARPKYIQTLPKRGYCFVAPVSDGDTHKEHRAVPNLAPDPPFSGIVGRDKELAQLAEQVELLASGQRRIVFITGEVGIGKTAVVDAFCHQLGQSPQVHIGRGQCVKGFGAKEEYYPVMEALSHLCATADGERACQVLAKMAPAWQSAMSRNSQPDLPNTPSSKERMPGELCAALEELSAEKPLVLIFEDLQWADESTLHLLSALARRRAKSNLMVLMSYNPKDTSPDNPLKELKQDLLMRRLCIEIALSPLSRAAVGELVSRELKQETLPAGLAAFICQHSEGNPLFVIAILEHLIGQHYLGREDKGSSAKSASVWVQRVPLKEMEAGVPDGLAKMIELEIERLSAEEQRLLEAGSLMSIAFPVWAVAAALDKDPSETEEACNTLTRRLYFLERAGQDELPDGSCSTFYVFSHGLYREVLYQRQVASRRAQRHIRIAEKLRAMFVGRESDVAREVAMHLEAAGSWDQALDSLRLAAQHAQERRAYSEALQLLEHALRMADNLQEAERAAAQRAIQSQLKSTRKAESGAAIRQPVLLGKA